LQKQGGHKEGRKGNQHNIRQERTISRHDYREEHGEKERSGENGDYRPRGTGSAGVDQQGTRGRLEALEVGRLRRGRVPTASKLLQSEHEPG